MQSCWGRLIDLLCGIGVFSTEYNRPISFEQSFRRITVDYGITDYGDVVAVHLIISVGGSGIGLFI